MEIKLNQSPVDVSFNLSGSLTGLPALIRQLPNSGRIGFDDMPEVWEDVSDIGQTWTPSIAGLELDITLPVYNALGVEKAPFTTDFSKSKVAYDWGNVELQKLLNT